MRRQLFITGLIAVTVGASLSGCTEKKEGPQTIIIELADPSDEIESSEEKSSIEKSASEDATETTEEYTEVESFEAETKALAAGYPQIEGLSDDILPKKSRRKLQAKIKRKLKQAKNKQTKNGAEVVMIFGAIFFVKKS